MIDVVVIGGGPSGLISAILAAQAGLKAVVIEAKPDTIDKACGEGLMPGAVAALQKMGVEVKTHHPFVGIRYIDGSKSAEGRFKKAPGWGVRRLELHDALRERAQSLDVEIRHMRAGKITEHEDSVEVCGIRARYCLAADGLRSKIRKQLNLEAPSKYAPRFGIRRHYRQAPWSDYVEVYWSEGAEAYVTPVGPDQIGVAILFNRAKKITDKGPYDVLIEQFPTLKERLTGQFSSNVRGAGPFEQRLTKRVKGRIMLVGDAAGYLDPITGEGIRLGLSSAKAAIACILANRPQDYEKKWRRLSRRYWLLTAGLLQIRRIRLLRKLIVPALRRIPFLFSIAVNALAHED